MRILILAPEVPHPIAKGSHARMDQIARVLALHHSVSVCVVSIRDPGVSALKAREHLTETYGEGVRVRVRVQRPGPLMRSASRFVGSAFAALGRPPQHPALADPG